MDTKARDNAQHSPVGEALSHESAELHVSGRARYIDDIGQTEGCLHLAPGYADAGCGKIVSLDLDAVRASEDVVAVLTAADIPGVNDCSPAAGDDPILAEDEILFHGQVVYLVVARTRLAARRATRLANIDVVARPVTVDIDQASQQKLDILAPWQFANCEPQSRIDAAKHRHRQRLSIGGQDHFYLEGQVAMATPGDNADMMVQSSTQHPTEIQQLVAAMLNLSQADVVCECRRMGGAFGGKESQAAQWACLAALAAWHTGYAAKLRLDRDDDMIMTGKRHEFEVDYEVGFDKDGCVQAVDATFASRCGYSVDLSLGVNDRCLFHADNAYYYPHYRLQSRRLKTDTVSNTAFRGFGGPQGVLFAEQMMQSIAIISGRDALDVRQANLYRQGADITPYGMQVEANNNPTAELMTTLAQRADYSARRKQIGVFNAHQPFLKKGLALTPVKFGIAFTLKQLNQTGALVHVYTDGSVQANHGGTEMGQGLNTKVGQVVAGVFAIEIENVRVCATRTDKVPNTTPTAASSGSDLNCMASLRAAQRIRKRMADVFARRHATTADAVVFEQGRVHGGGHSVSFSELAQMAFEDRIGLSEVDHYATPKITWDRETQRGRPFLYFAYGAALSEVTVDTSTGEMRVDAVDILHDVGHSLNPALDIGQIEGAFVQGMGWLTTEQVVIDTEGRVRTHAPSTYKIPVCADVPTHFNVQLYDSPGCEEQTIFRSKAVGEPPLMLATSVYCAIMDAIASVSAGQVAPLKAPATAESILNALKAVR